VLQALPALQGGPRPAPYFLPPRSGSAGGSQMQVNWTPLAAGKHLFVLLKGIGKESHGWCSLC
jgi:hypothetical protein